MDRPIDLYYGATPNVQKVVIALEELELPYTKIPIDIHKDEQFAPEFKRINPNSKIPAIVDYQGPKNQPITLFESGAILLYLADKMKKLLPAEGKARYQCLSWLFWQMAGIGPMFGQFGHFYRFGGTECQDPYPLKRYQSEATRLLGVLNQRVETQPYLGGDEFTIADCAVYPWLQALKSIYHAWDTLQVEETYSATMKWVRLCEKRSSVRRGMEV